MKNFLLWRLLRRKPPRDAEARRAFAERMRREAFGNITDEQRAADRQLLADAVNKKGSLI